MIDPFCKAMAGKQRRFARYSARHGSRNDRLQDGAELALCGAGSAMS
jgi:hypothetical protein